MAKQKEMTQDLRERLGKGDMTLEEFTHAVEEYLSQRLREAESCETGERVTEREFRAAKAALLDILTDQRNTPSQRLRAVEYLAALPKIFEQLQWSIML